MKIFEELAQFGGDKNVIETCPFKDEHAIQALRFRPSPYFHILAVGFHIGIYRPHESVCTWTARVMTEDKRYLQCALGPALDLGRGKISLDEALHLAFRWFEKSGLCAQRTSIRPVGRTERLEICPWGPDYSVAHALNDYISWSKLARSKGGHYNSLILANHHIVPWLAHVPLEEFNAVHMQALAEKVLTTPRKLGFTHDFKAVPFESLSTEDLRRRKRTYNSLITILRVAFKNAYDSGKIQSERPWRCLRRISVRHAPRLLFLDRDECTLLIEACLPALSKLVRAALYTGCRVGELGQMTVKDVGREGYGVRVAAFKASPARFVFLPDEGMSFFLRQCEGKTANEPLFLSPKNKPWRGQHSALFRNAVAKAGLPRELVFHGLRHTYASDLIRSGVSLELVAKQLGHANVLTVSNTYGHLAEQYREEIIRKAFSPLVNQEVDRIEGMSDKLQKVWSKTQSQEWRKYAQCQPNGTVPRKSYARTPTEVLQVFQRAEIALP